MKREDAGPAYEPPPCRQAGCTKTQECSHVDCGRRKPITADFTQRSFYKMQCCDRPWRVQGVCANCGDDQ